MQSVSERREYFNKYFDARGYVDLYYAPQSGFISDAITKPIEVIANIFRSGMVKGDTLLDFACAPTIHQVLPACIEFKEITMMNVTKGGAEELEKWWRNEPGAIDWSAYVMYACTLACSGEQWEEKQDKLRNVITKILSCDLIGCNPFAPLENSLFDCIICTYPLGCLSDAKASFSSLLRNMYSLLRTGGHLILMESIGCTFFVDSKLKFPYLRMDEEFFRETLKEAGFITKQQVVIPRNNNQHFDLIDFKAIVISVAQKP